jgi:hypothetical protein
LEGNEKYLEKLQSVLHLFRDRKDIVLWWRPHPLNEVTCQAMRPQLLKNYQRLVDEYRRDGYGIYDDTPDMHRAISMSDAYYGDSGSLVMLYGMTEKLIMFQNNDIVRYREGDGHDFAAIIGHILRRYEEDQSLKKNYYIAWEDEDYILNAYLDYMVLHSNETASFKQIISRRKELLKDNAILNDGNSGAVIYDYFKKLVLK